MTSNWEGSTLVSCISTLYVFLWQVLPSLAVVTSFDTARDYIHLIDDLPWTCIFVDEAHKIKNPKSKITKAYHMFTCIRRFGLTGTAIQNDYMEMWTVLDWTNPGRLGLIKQWKGYVVQPLTAGQSSGATEEVRSKALVSGFPEYCIFFWWAICLRQLQLFWGINYFLCSSKEGAISSLAFSECLHGF